VHLPVSVCSFTVRVSVQRVNPVFDVLIRLGKARLARALNVTGALKPPRRDKLDEKSRDQLAQALWLLERLKDQPELSPDGLISFGACAAVIGHFAPFSELPLTHREVTSHGGIASGVKRAETMEKWHVEARDHMAAVEKEKPGLSPRKLGEIVIDRCKIPVGIEAMAKFIRDERKKQPGSN
jgi:hypothetical protein